MRPAARGRASLEPREAFAVALVAFSFGDDIGACGGGGAQAVYPSTGPVAFVVQLPAIRMASRRARSALSRTHAS